MGLIQKIIEWANSGAITEPSETKQDLGWVNNEQPPHEYENFKQNEQDTHINKLIEINNRNANNAYEGDYSSDCDHIPIAREMHYPCDSENVYYNDSAEEIYCMCRGYSHSLEKESVFAVDAIDNSTIIEYYNDDDFEISSVEHAVTLDSGYDIKSMCCDGDYLYCAADNGSSGKVYKFDINPWNATPVDSVAMTVGHVFGPSFNTRCIIADDDNIAVFSSADFSDAPVAIIDKATMTASYGDGNNATFTTETLKSGFASDGTRVWFATRSAFDSKIYICNALISDPTTGTGSPLLLSDETSDNDIGGIIADRKNVFIISSHDDSGTPEYYTQIGLYNIASGYWRPLTYKIEDSGVRIDGTDLRILFDGLRLWFRTPFKPVTNETINEEQECVFALHPASFECFSEATLPKVTDPIRYFVYELGASYAPSNVSTSGFVFADDCLWLGQREDSKTVIRVPSISRL